MMIETYCRLSEEEKEKEREGRLEILMSSCRDERFRSELPLYGELLDYFESLGSDLDLDSLKVFLFLLFLPHLIHYI